MGRILVEGEHWKDISFGVIEVRAYGRITRIKLGMPDFIN